MGTELFFTVQILREDGAWHQAEGIRDWLDRFRPFFDFLDTHGIAGLPDDVDVEREPEEDIVHVHVLAPSRQRIYLGYYGHAHALLADLLEALDVEISVERTSLALESFEQRYWTEIAPHEGPDATLEDHPEYRALASAREDAARAARAIGTSPHILEKFQGHFQFLWLRDLGRLCEPFRTRILWGFGS